MPKDELLADLKKAGREVAGAVAAKRKARRKSLAERLQERLDALEARVEYLEGRDRARGLSGMTIGGPTQ